MEKTKQLLLEALAALEAVDALIEHSYTGSSKGMRALQDAANEAHRLANEIHEFLYSK